MMSRLHGDPFYIAQENQYQRRGPAGSTTATTLYDVPVPRFEGDEPRPPASDSSVIIDVPLPSMTGGSSRQVPNWRGSVGPSRPSGPSSTPRPWSRGNQRTFTGPRPKGAQHGQSAPGQYEWVWNAWRDEDGTSYSPESDEQWRRRGDARGSRQSWDSRSGRWYSK